MTPREEVLEVLRGGSLGRVPFTMFEELISTCAAEREMRNRGLCIVKKTVDVFRTHMPNVKVSQYTYMEGKKKFVRTMYETPEGDLSTLGEVSSGYTTWLLEKMFKSPDDYKALLFMIRDEVYEQTYEGFARARDDFGGDAVFRLNFGREPLQTLISCEYMDMQTFCMEWMDNRDEILKLYDAIIENRRRIYPIVAESPALVANYGGNVTPEVIGLETFEKYYIQHYNEAAEVMHKKGKFIGSHFDANCKLISEAIAGTDLDYIEAFTPAPDTDMTLAQAREAWPDKVLWLNFPSSVHLAPDSVVEQTTVDLLDELDSTQGIIMGITEDIPPERWRNSCMSIIDGLERHAREHPHMYRQGRKT